MTDTLFAKLEKMILTGEIAPGSRFPSQKDISAQENVSRTVVREAVARLAAKGLVTSRQGAGVFAAEDAQPSAFQVSNDDLNELSGVIQLLEMRLAVETEMAGLAASRRTTDDIKQIRSALDRILAQVADPSAASQADRDFHMAIARSTKNEHFIHFIDFYGSRLVPSRSLYIRDQSAAAHAAYAQCVQAEHEAILDAIVRMDPAKARDAARTHMQESLTRHMKLANF